MHNIDGMFNELGVSRGDIVHVSSNIVNFCAGYQREINSKFTPQDMVYSLMRAVTKEGTLLFPTFNWDFCRGIGYDARKTKSKTGVLGISALKTDGFKRTKHPIYSFAVWGKYRDYLYGLDNASSFGKDSPFAFLHRKNAKNLIIDVEYRHSLTFTHYVEECIGVDSRFLKPFVAPYTGDDGITVTKTYSMYVRDLNKNVLPIDEGEVFYDELVHKRAEFCGAVFKVLLFGEVYRAVETEIVCNYGARLGKEMGPIV